MSEQFKEMEREEEVVVVPSSGPAPQSGNGSTPRRSGGGGIAFAAVLIVLGGALLLDNLNLVSINWLNLLRYWPVILIVVGIELLLGRRSFLGGAVGALLTLGIVAGVVWFIGVQEVGVGVGRTGIGRTGFGDPVTTSANYDLGNVDAMDVRLDMGIGLTNVTTTGDDEVAATADFVSVEGLEYVSSFENGTLHIEQQGDLRVPNFNFDDVEIRADIVLSEAVPLDIDLNAGVGELNFDLSDAQLTNFEVEAGVGSLSIELPDSGSYTVDINGGVGEVILDIPSDMEARIEVDGGLGDVSVDQRFESRGENVYESSGYEEGEDGSIFINIDGGIGSVEIDG